MLDSLKTLESYKVFQFFKEMNQHPRGSKNEKEISDWLVQFGKDRNLEVIQDEALNVIIRKPGTKGYENSPIVVIQGHMDMVCEKDACSDHNFLKDPIDFVVEGDVLRANKTTLGADDGIAIAMGLAILDSNDISHPPIELLATTEEEVGMGGAQHLDPKNIKGRRMINIDSEEEGKLLVSCSGGVREVITLPIIKEQNQKQCYRIFVHGLQGGHSGMEIDKQRGNANKILGRILYDLSSKVKFNLVSINGGAKMNAIPRESEAIIAIQDNEIVNLQENIDKWNKILKVELNAQDKEVEVSLNKVIKSIDMFTKESTEKTIGTLMLIPNGIETMSKAIEGLVESSTNLGIVATTDKSVHFESTVRSSVGTLKEFICNKGKLISSLYGAKIELLANYPEWQYNPDSKLRETLVGVYKELYKEEPEISAIHAGLECGLFSGKFNGEMDMISVGPNIFDVHTPKEHLSVSSTDRVYGYILKVLEALK